MFSKSWLVKNAIVCVLVLVMASVGHSQSAQSLKPIISKCEFKEGNTQVTYPQLYGMANKDNQDKINGFIKQIADSFISRAKDLPPDDNYEAKMSFEICLEQVNLLSMKIQTYTFTGGVHGHSELNGFTFDLRTGDIIRFSELFNFNYESKQKINNQIIQQINKRDINIFKPFKGVGDNPNYYLKEGNKVVIIFQEYEIAPFSSGILEFELEL